MRTLLFAHKINGNPELSGLVDVSQNPPQPFCLCDKETAEEILEWYKAHQCREFMEKITPKKFKEWKAKQGIEDGQVPTYIFSPQTEKDFEELKQHNDSLKSEADNLGLINPDNK